MHRVVIEEPYEFIPPHRGRLFTWAFRVFLLKRFLRRTYGICDWSFEGLDHLRASLKAGHGILLCPNHCRPSDPMLMGLIVRETPCYIYAMASWHVFKQSRLERYVANRLGGFSVYREGLDRQALDTSIDIVASAERPLVIFPEGVISRANDRLMPLMDGVSFVARMAAKKRQKLAPNSQVVIHPMAVRYELKSGSQSSLEPALRRLEERTFSKCQNHLPADQRISRLIHSMVAAREIEHFGLTRQGSIPERIAGLTAEICHPLEKEWLGAARTGDIVGRVKDLRSAILPDLLNSRLSPEDRRRRWRQLTDAYYLQCLSLYPAAYLDDGIRGTVTDERLIETVHRLEEDLTDTVTLRPEWHVRVRIGEPMEVSPGQKRSRMGDSIMSTLRSNMLNLLGVEDWWPPEPVVPIPKCEAELTDRNDRRTA